MSEKPFWAGKTCKELEGLRVKIAWDNGDTLTSTLNLFGNAGQCELSPARHPAATFAPYADIKSIELLDDPKYERIDDIHDVCEGDIFVATNGNKFSVVAVDFDDDETDCTLAVMVQAEDPDFHAWMFNSNFAYALRLKPKLPDHDGLWWDKDNALWSVAISGLDNSKLVALLIGDPESPVTGSVWSGLNSKHVTSQAPFRPAKAVEA